MPLEGRRVVGAAGRLRAWAPATSAQPQSLPTALAGEPYTLAPLLAGCSLVALHHWRRTRRPLVRIRWPRSRRRGVARARW